MGGLVPVLLLVGFVGGLIGGLYLLSWLAHRWALLDAGPLVVPPYMSGLPPVEHAVSRFHVRWYALTLLFLVFDMEMIFMYPWAVVVADIGVVAVVEMFTFLAILMVGVVYAWREGALRWT